MDFKPETITPHSLKNVLMTNRVMNFGRDRIGRAAMIVRNRFHKPGEFDAETMTRYGVFMINKTVRLSEQ